MSAYDLNDDQKTASSGSSTVVTKFDKNNPAHICVTVVLHNVCARLSVRRSPPRFQTFLTPIIHLIHNALTCGAQNKDFYRIKNISGVIKPGEMTIVLSPPGHGKSSYLKAIAGQLHVTSGEVLYNGRTRSQAAHFENCDVRKLAQYLEQTDDVLLPTLNLYESMTFANQMSSAKYDPAKINNIIEEIGLVECKSTLVSQLSGGQRRRLNAALSLCGDATVLALDEYSNGLDSAVTEKIGRFFQRWCRENGNSVVCALQQPTPDLFDMFDQLVLLRDGEVVFHGPCQDIVPYLNAMGFVCSSDVDICDFILNVLTEPRITLQNTKVMQARAAKSKSGSSLLMQKQLTSSLGQLHESPSPCITTEEMVQFYHSTPFYEKVQQDLSPYIKSNSESSSSSSSTTVASFESHGPIITPETYNMYSTGFRQSLFMMLLFVCIREFKLTSRSIPPIIFRFAMSFFIAWIHASLYYDVGVDDYTMRISAMIVGFTQPTFNQMGTLADAVMNKPVLLKETISSMYPAWTYNVACLITSLPSTLMEAMTFTMIYYFMQNYYLGWWEWLMYYFMQTTVSFIMAGYFRLAAMLMPDIPAAAALAAPSSLYLILLAGFFVREDYVLNNAPYFWTGVYFWDPLSWALRNVAINEFKSTRYNDLIVNAYTQQIARKGDVYLYYVNIKSDPLWILWGIIYLFALLIVFIIIQSIVVWRPYVDFSRGSQRIDDESESTELEDIENANVNEPEQRMLQDNINENVLQQQQLAAKQYAKEHNIPGNDTQQDNDDSDDDHHHTHIPAVTSLKPHNSTNNENSISASVHSTVLSTQLSQLQSSMGSHGLRALTEKLQFSPVYLSFSNIRYTVRVTDLDGVSSDRVLLAGINGCAKPGTMLALMGASGAGKTTLLDVLSNRKTAGVMEGTILYNGAVTSKEQQAAMTCYVEQFSSLFAFSTVEETLVYAARLRLPRSVSEAVKKQVALEVMDVLDLTPIRNSVVGGVEVGILGLSPSQLKRLSIGVELVANPSVLFLDEPTTGLDSKSAQVVMRAVKRVARSGRSIICTIHQPSSELFFLFDSLVLLGPGGHQIYYGDLGYRSELFMKYFSSIPGVLPKLNPRINPANWMLEQASKDIPADADETAVNAAKNGAENWADLRNTQKWILTLKQYYFTNANEWIKQRKILDRLEAIHYTIHPELKPDDFIMPQEQKKQPQQEELNANDNIPQAVTPLAIENNPTPKSSHGGKQKTTEQSFKVDLDAVVNGGVDHHQKPFWWYQLFWYTLRQSQLYWRNPPIIIIRTFVQILCSVVSGLIYLKIKPTNQSNLISYMASLTLTTAGCFANTMGTITPVLAAQKPVQYRERYSGFYSFPWFYCFSNYIIEIVFCFPFAVFTTIPVYFMVGLPNDAGVFFRYLLATYMVDLVAMSAMSFFVSVSPNQGVAQLFLGCFNSLATAYNGAAIPWTIMNGWNQFLFCVTPLGFLGWSYLDAALEGDVSPITLIDGATTIQRPVGEYAKEYFGYAHGYYWKCFAWFITQIVGWQVLFYLSTIFIVFNRR